MPEYKILYVDHAPDAEVYQNVDAMEDAGAVVHRARSIDQVQDKLAGTLYDLVVSDAKFLEPDQSHDEYGDGKYRLNEVLRLLRPMRDNTRIVAFTKKSEELFEEHPEDLEALDDVWEQNTSPPFITWRVERFMRKAGVDFASHTLADALVARIDKNPDAFPWPDEMKSMLAVYRQYRGERDQAEQVGNFVGKIAGTFGLEAQSGCRNLLKLLVKTEPLNVAAKTKAWGHLRHVINVFWLGYFILNCTQVERGALIAYVLDDDRSDDPQKDWQRVNFAWLVAALFHDVGLFGERFSRLFDESVKACHAYGAGEAGVQMEPPNKCTATVRFDCRKAMEDALNTLSRSGQGEEARWLTVLETAIKKPTAEDEATVVRIDHGIFSSAVILSNLESAGLGAALPAAARAAALHNYANLQHTIGAEPPKLSALHSPLSCLLVLCDQVEVWDRRTGLESKLKGLEISGAELAGLEVQTDGSVILNIAYHPYRSALPVAAELDRLEHALTEKLMGDVYPALSKVDWDKSPFPKVYIKPQVGGKDLPSWPDGN